MIRSRVVVLGLVLACAAPVSAQEPSAADLAGDYQVVGQNGAHRTRSRLRVEPVFGDTFRVTRRTECGASGETHVHQGEGRLRRGLLLVEFERSAVDPFEARAQPADPALELGSPPPSGLRQGGLAGAVERADGEQGGQTQTGQADPADAGVKGASAERPIQPLPGDPGSGPLWIEASVGEEGVNAPSDVAIVGRALVAVGFLPRADVPMPELILAIRRYQRDRAGFNWPDGRVDVDNRTLRALNRESVLASGASAGPASESLSGGGPTAGGAPGSLPDDDGAPIPPAPLGLTSQFPDLPADAAVAVYLVVDGRLQGAALDPECRGEPGEWTSERGVAVDPDETIDSGVRARIAAIASRYPGLGWAFPDTREAYAELLFPHDTEFNKRQFAEKMWSCGLFAMAVLRQLGKAHRSLDTPYASQIGQAVNTIERIAREDGAWVQGVSGVPAPHKGDIVTVGGSDAYGGTAHVMVLTDVSGAEVSSVDGGQPHIAACTRPMTRKADGTLWIGKRRVYGYLSADGLQGVPGL